MKSASSFNFLSNWSKRYLYSRRQNGFFYSTQPTPSSSKPFRSIPGLSTLPLLGPLHHFFPIFGTIGPRVNFLELAKILNDRFGNIVKLEGIFARADMVFLFKPEEFDKVYRSEEINPLRPGFETFTYYRTQLRQSTYEGVHGLTIAQGPEWRDIRTKVNPAMLKPKLVKLYAPALDDISKEMVARLMKLKDDGNYLQNNFDLEIRKLALESVALIGLGTRLGCLKDHINADDPARKIMNYAKDVIDLAYKLEFLPSLWKYVSTPNFKKLVHTLDSQWELNAKYIYEAKRKIEERGYDVPEEDKSIIEKLLAIDEKVAVMMASEMLFAGTDTVAFTLTGLIYNLAINQDVQVKLREKVRSCEPNMRYLKACIKESLRMYPVIPAHLRRTTKEHIVSDYIIPKGVDVIAPNEYLSLSEKYYPRPTEFIPERWLVDKTDPLYYGNAHPMVTLPFGFGVRMCIGRRIAELEIESFTKELIAHLKITWEGPPIKTETRVMNTFVKPYYFKFDSVK